MILFVGMAGFAGARSALSLAVVALPGVALPGVALTGAALTGAALTAFAGAALVPAVLAVIGLAPGAGLLAATFAVVVVVFAVVAQFFYVGAQIAIWGLFINFLTSEAEMPGLNPGIASILPLRNSFSSCPIEEWSSGP